MSPDPINKIMAESERNSRKLRDDVQNAAEKLAMFDELVTALDKATDRLYKLENYSLADELQVLIDHATVLQK